MAGGMKKLRVSSFELRVASCDLEQRNAALVRPKVFNSKLETRNSKLSIINSQRTAGPFALAAALIAWPLSGGAQAVLNDPTRPPAGIYLNAPGDTGAISAPLLQSVMISPTARSAIIGGETVKLGGKYGEARVIKITESEVVLRSANGTETLRMYPGVTMKPVEPAPPVSKKPARENRSPATNTRGRQG